MYFFFIAGENWYNIKYLVKNGTRTIFFKYNWEAFQLEPTVQTIFTDDWLWKAGTLTKNKRLSIYVNNYRHLTTDFIHDGNETEKRTFKRPT